MTKLQQPTGYHCGPTCLKFIGDQLGLTNDVTIYDIGEVCGSDSTTGTCDVRMKKGMDHFGIRYNVGKSQDTSDLAKYIQDGNLIILRTLLWGIKHWIVLDGYQTGFVNHIDKDRDMFHVMDPAQGRVSYSHERVLEIWKPRNFDYFEIPIFVKPKYADPTKVREIAGKIMDANSEVFRRLADS